MRVLVIGGTGFIGPYVIRDLLAQGHQVAAFHRGESEAGLPDVQHILGDRGALSSSSAEFQRFAPDVVVDFILASERQAVATMGAFRGIAGRVVALSSGDVYRASAILHRLDTGPLQTVPLTEESDLRAGIKPYPAERIEMFRRMVPWLEDDYDKIPVERVVMGDAEIAGTIVRLPMVYGPGDKYHRLHPHLKRMDDGRRAILIQESAAGWRGPRGYVENVAAGIVLAATSASAAGRIYNLAEERAFSEMEWAEEIGRIVRWKGKVVAVPDDRIPGHLRIPYNAAQHWTMSSARIRGELGYSEAVPFDVGLERTVEWERFHPPAEVDLKQFDYAAEDAAAGGS